MTPLCLLFTGNVCCFQQLVEGIRSQQVEIDEFSDEAKILQQITSEPRISSYANQLTTRYHALVNTTKDIMKKCEKNVKDHDTYTTLYDEAVAWLDDVKKKRARCAALGNTKDQLQAKQTIVQVCCCFEWYIS